MVLFEPIPQDEKCILDLVRFENVLINYNKNYNLYVNFSLDLKLKGSTMDWIGIFKAGWDKYESFLAFEWGIGEPIDNSSRKRRIIFDSQYLKNAQLNMNYQFVYISKHLEILGVSQFFQFIDDDRQNESFCLNASFIPSGNIHNSTEYQISRDEYLEHLKENVSPVKRARPSCSINLPNNWEQAYTACWRCKSLFEMKNKHNEMIAKLQECTEQNEQLKERLNKLEIALENVWVPKTLLDPWDESAERMKFQHFVSLMSAASTEGYEKGDHWCEKNAVIHPPENASSSYDYFSNEVSSREILLKAIIGSQEDKIRELNRTVTQMQRLMFGSIPRSLIDNDVVTLVKTKERMLPEIIDLKKEDHIMKDENDNRNTLAEENLIKEQQAAAGDKLVEPNDAIISSGNFQK